MTLLSAHSPVRNGSNSITLWVKFAEFGEELPFTASSGDSESYGRAIYQRAASGEFGAVQ